MNRNTLPDKLPTGDMSEYRAMSMQDRVEYFVVRINGHWVCLEFLDYERDDPAYYYFSPSGYVGFGPYAAEESIDKGILPARGPVAQKADMRGKYGRRSFSPPRQ